MSRRRSVNPTTAISVTLPRRLVEELDEILAYSQSRSRWIAQACQDKMQKYDSPLLEDASERQLMAVLHHTTKDETLKALLFQILSK